MIWFFERSGQYVRIETRLCVEAEGYELVVTRASEAERIEHFDEEAALLARYKELCRELTASGWGEPASWRI